MSDKPPLKLTYNQNNYGYVDNLALQVGDKVIKISKYLETGWKFKLGGGYYTDYQNSIIHICPGLRRKNQQLHIISIFHEIAHSKLHRAEKYHKEIRNNNYKCLIIELEAWIWSIKMLEDLNFILPETKIINKHIFDSIKSQIDDNY